MSIFQKRLQNNPNSKLSSLKTSSYPKTFFELHKKIAYKKNLKVISFGIKSNKANIKLSSIKPLGKQFKINIMKTSNLFKAAIFTFSLFLNYIGFWETSLLQGGPALYCRAELHCTALKGDM